MGWEDAVAEIKRRHEFASRMGGEERVARHRAEGKYTIRERIDRLVDPGSFLEVGSLAGKGIYEDGKLIDFGAAAYVMGLATIDGRPVAVGGEDRTVRGTGGTRGKQRFLEKMAMEYQVPLVRFIEGVGADVQTIESLGHTYLANSSDWSVPIRLLSEVPVLGAIVGPAAGAPAVDAMLSHWITMVRGNGQLFAAGPPVVRRAIGRDITKEELGGAAVQTESGTAHNDAANEDEAFDQIRRIFGYLPMNLWELPPYRQPTDKPDRRAEELLSIVPEQRTKPYDMRKLVRLVVDDGEFFEIQPKYGRAAIVGFARMNGHVVGINANDPKFNGGAIDGPTADKQTHFIEMCDSFRIPIINFVDVPGVMIGPQAERSGALRRGVRAFWMAYNATVPQVAIVVRKCYGLAGAATGNGSKMNLRLAWPSGEWGSLPIEGGVDAAFRREIEAAPDPAAKRKEIEERMLRFRSPFATAEAFGVEEVIDPRDTRPLIIRFLEVAVRSMSQDLRPKRYPGIRP